MKNILRNVGEIASFRLCVGCGACYYICPEKKVELYNFKEDGIRPIVNDCNSIDCFKCIDVCPGIHTSTNNYNKKNDNFKYRRVEDIHWGSYIELWEGNANDNEINYKGSSGGLCTALSSFCLEEGISAGTLHIAQDPKNPLINKTVLSKTTSELIERTGSRYAPASPCDKIEIIEKSVRKIVFVGKPCDIAALNKIYKLKPIVEKNSALSIGFFCAGTPATLGLEKLLKKNNIDFNSIDTLRYRGKGWPGKFNVKFKDRHKKPYEMSYRESWGFLQKFRPFRCYLCPDLTAENADISVGDPWHRKINNDEIGKSLIIIRTEKGKEIFRKALEKGYIDAKKINSHIIYRSQKNLLGKRQSIWGRILAMRILRIPFPEFTGFHLFENWMESKLKVKAISIFGTAKRILKRNYYKQIDFERMTKI